MPDLPLQGRVALVAGASKGIGAAVAEAFAAAGAAVVLGARDLAALESVAQRIESRGGRAIAVRTDVADVDSARDLVGHGLAAFGRLDAAFNNATDGPLPAPLADIDPAEFDRGIATNIRGTFLGMKFQIPAMLRKSGGGRSAGAGAERGGGTSTARGREEQSGGAIVNMASVAGLTGTANLAAYVAGKAGIVGLTKVAALDYADQGVRVNVVAPGPILTHHLQAAGPEAQRLAGLSTPMRRTGTAEEVAQTVVWLCSDQSSFITGAVIPIDGGQSAGNKPPQMYRQGQGMTGAAPNQRTASA
jgi:NAD(P)-dependent dehydrogenase (short-subunit alcohol dehydrogenase family)